MAQAFEHFPFYCTNILWCAIYGNVQLLFYLVIHDIFPVICAVELALVIYTCRYAPSAAVQIMAMTQYTPLPETNLPGAVIDSDIERLLCVTLNAILRGLNYRIHEVGLFLAI